MAQGAEVVIHFKDLPVDEDLREHLEERCLALADEFPETSRYELTIGPESNSVEGHCHVTGKKTAAAAHITGAETPRHAGDQVLDKLQRELRKDHDKRIFAPRRKAQKARGKRTA